MDEIQQNTNNCVDEVQQNLNNCVDDLYELLITKASNQQYLKLTMRVNELDHRVIVQ